jgi:hypothetical protein
MPRRRPSYSIFDRLMAVARLTPAASAISGQEMPAARAARMRAGRLASDSAIPESSCMARAASTALSIASTVKDYRLKSRLCRIAGVLCST